MKTPSCLFVVNRAFALAAGALLLSGCNREEITTYQVPKETAPAVSASAPPRMTESEVGSRPGIQWSRLPEGWKETPATGMRAASFSIHTEMGDVADLAVTPLAAGPGMEPGSVNMWRGELGLAEVSAEEAARTGEEVTIAGGRGMLYDLRGSLSGKPSRILGAVLQRDGMAWFFKMRGPDALVAAQKPALIQFLGSVVFAQAGTASAPTTPPSAPPVAAAPASGRATANIPPPDGIARWEVPAHWQAAPPKTMLLAVMNVPGGAEMTVSSFPGDVGGLRANVERWRRQIGLGAATEDDMAKTTRTAQINGKAVTLVDIRNAADDKATLAAILPHAGNSWFLKLSGPGAVIEKEKPAFITFTESIRFP